MTFLSPGFLLGLGAAAVPLVIHLLARRSKRSIDFSSLLFLRDIQKSSITWYTIREKYLLFVRTMLLVSVPLALSRPLCTGGEIRTVDILVLDRSASMDGAHGTVWSEAIGQARTFLRRNRSAIHSIWTAGSTATLAAYEGSVTESLDLFTTLSPTGEGFDCGSVMSDLRDWARKEGVERIRIHLVSDFQSSNWEQVESFLPDIEVYGIPVSGVQENIAIEDVHITGLSSPVHGSMVAQIELANYGTEDITTDLGIRWGGESHTSSVMIPPGGTYVELPLSPPRGGVTRGYVSIIDSTGITMDNRFDLVFSTRDRPTIAIIGGSEEERRRVHSALVPSPAFASDFQVKVLNDRAFVASDLDDISAAIMFPMPVSGIVRDALDQQRARGMGVVVLCSRDDLPDSWCDAVEAIAGTCPRDESVPGPEHGGSMPPESSLRHPILSVFRGVGGVSLPHVWRYYPWPFYHGRVLVGLSDKIPLLVETSQGGGRVIVWTTGFLPPMSDWSSRSSFVPLFRRCIFYAGGDIRVRAVHCGATIDVAVVCPNTGCSFSMENPDGSVTPLVLSHNDGGGSYIRVMLGYRPGAHVIRRDNRVVTICHAVIDSVERIPGIPGNRPGPVRFPGDRGDYTIAAASDFGVPTVFLLGAGLCMLLEVILTGTLATRQRFGAGSGSSHRN